MWGRCSKQNKERKRETEREARQLGAPTDTHFCLSSFPLRAGSRRVTVGLHFWQTRGSSSLTKPCTTPPWLSAAVIKPRQPEPSNKKLTRYRSTAANFREVVSKDRHCADNSGRGEGLLLGWGKTLAFSLITEIPPLVDDFTKLSAQEWSYCYVANEEKQPSVQCDIPITKSKWGFLPFQSIAIPCSACMSLHFLINTSTHREVSWAGAQCPERCFELN